MATSIIQQALAKPLVDTVKRGDSPARHADFIPVPISESMRGELDSRLYAEFGERRPPTTVLSDVQIQRCAGLFAQLDRNSSQENKVRDSEKLLYASGYISLALTTYYGATIFFASDMRTAIVTSTDHPEVVLIPAALFVSGLFLLGRATSVEFKLREQAWHDCLGKKEAYGREGGALGQIRFEALPVDLSEAALTSVATADAITSPVFHHVKPSPEFSFRIPIPTLSPSKAIVLTGTVAVAAAIGIAILFAPVGI